MLQQLYPYRHAYLSLYLVTYADNQAYNIFIHIQAMHISCTWIMSITCIHMIYFQTVFLYTYTITVTFIITYMIMFSILLIFCSCNHISYSNHFYNSFTILFIHLNLVIPKYFLQTEVPLHEFLGTMGSKFEYTYFKKICFPRSLVYPKI